MLRPTGTHAGKIHRSILARADVANIGAAVSACSAVQERLAQEQERRRATMGCESTQLRCKCKHVHCAQILSPDKVLGTAGVFQTDLFIPAHGTINEKDHRHSPGHERHVRRPHIHNLALLLEASSFRGHAENHMGVRLCRPVLVAPASH